MHEIWQVDCGVRRSGVFVNQQSVVDEFPTESVGNYDNDAFRASSFWRFGDIGGEAVERRHRASGRCVCSFGASEAVGTRHSAPLKMLDDMRSQMGSDGDDGTFLY